MEIPVLGMDPSLRHWGLAEANLCLKTGVMDTPLLSLVEPKDLKGKQVRNNSNDLHIAEQLSSKMISVAKKAKVIFVEVPVGSKSARAMASYGICVGILGAIRAMNIPLIEVTATEVKLALSGDPNASKATMIEEAMAYYPEAVFPQWRGQLAAKAEHVADAIGAIHAGVKTPMFQNLLRLFQPIQAQ